MGLTRREAIYLKLEVEGSYSVDPTPDASNAMFVDNPSWNNEIKTLERPGTWSTLGRQQHVYGGGMASFSFSVELKGSGTAGVAPEFAAAFLACGMRETVVADTSVTYNTDSVGGSNGHRSCTIYYFQDGKIKRLNGARGEVNFEFTSQEIMKANFTFHGLVGTEADIAMPTPTYSTVKPFPFVGASFSFGGVPLAISSLTVDLGNEMSKPMNVNASRGYGEIRIAGRDVKGSIDPEAIAVAAKAFYNELETNATSVLTTGAIGNVAGNLTTLSAPVAYLKNISESDRESIRTQELELGFAENTGDDEISLIFT